MATDKFNQRISSLFRREAWAEAQKLLEKESAKDPQNHWLLTQLGVTLCEQHRYSEAMPCFSKSIEFVPDCPLTLWNLAGSLDALGKHAEAIRVFIWLLECKKTPKQDPCWESKEWSETLKADCMYRLGECCQRVSKMKTAEHWYRQYANLLLSGIKGSYSIEDTMQHLKDLQGSAPANGARNGMQKAVDAAIEASGLERRNGRGNKRASENLKAILVECGAAKNLQREVMK